VVDISPTPSAAGNMRPSLGDAKVLAGLAPFLDARSLASLRVCFFLCTPYHLVLHTREMTGSVYKRRSR
jgi:hypothetical protein